MFDKNLYSAKEELVGLKSLKKALITACFVGMGISGSANAAFVSCQGTGYDLSTHVSNDIACGILAPLNGQVNDSTTMPVSSYTVNAESFFGITNWLFDGKFDNGSDTSALFNFLGNGTAGSYTLAGTGSYSDLMLVFKDGDGTNLVGYRLNVASPNGTYTSPFTDPPFNLPGNSAVHDISHISVYYRNGGTVNPGGDPLPEPGTTAIFGLGLLGMGFVSLRNRKKQS